MNNNRTSKGKQTTQRQQNAQWKQRNTKRTKAAHLNKRKEKQRNIKNSSEQQ